MLNFTTFADAKSYYQFWDSLDHKSHTSNDFIFHALIRSALSEETEDQCVERLKRTMPSSKQPPRYGTLIRSLKHLLDFDGFYAGRYKQFLHPKEARNDQGLIREQAKVLLDSLASKIASSAPAQTEAA